MYKDYYYYSGPTYEERLASSRKEQERIDAITDVAQRIQANRSRYRCGNSFVTLADIQPWERRVVELARTQQPKTTPDRATVPAPTTKAPTTEAPTTEAPATEAPLKEEKERPAAVDTRSSPYPSYPARNPVSFGWGFDRGFDRRTATVNAGDKKRRFSVNAEVNERVALFQGDITTLEIDAIVNAANESLRGGGGIDGAIHRAAGPLLEDAGGNLNGCVVGKAKITDGFALPARYVIHTVGPVGKGDALLRSCYLSSLELVVSQSLRSVAFCCVSTGIFGFPLVRAAHIALRTVRMWLDDPKNRASCDKIIFCVFTSEELGVYEALMPSYFPIEGFPTDAFPPGEGDAVPIAVGAEEEERKALEIPRGGWWDERSEFKGSAFSWGGGKWGDRK